MKLYTTYTEKQFKIYEKQYGTLLAWKRYAMEMIYILGLSKKNPSKVKELLQEFALVIEEVAKLDTQQAKILQNWIDRNS